MIRKITLFLLITSFWLSACAQSDKQEIKNFEQQIHANIDVKNSILSITDTLYLQKTYFETVDNLVFELNKNLELKVLNKGFSLHEMQSADYNPKKLTKTYSLSTEKEIAGDKVMLVLQYSGKIIDEIKEGTAEYARGFSETQGTITEKGVYLAASTYWLPTFDFDALWSFDLTVKIDTSWNVVSQGERTINKSVGNKQIIKYHSPEPMDEVYLIAAQWTEYSLQAGDVLVQAFLRTPDAKLANKYLGVHKICFG